MGGGDGGDGGVSLHQLGHHSSGGLNTQGQGGDIQEQEVRHGLVGVTGEDGGLNSGAIGHSLVRVDGLVELLAVEEVLEKLLDLGDPSGPPSACRRTPRLQRAGWRPAT